MLKNGKMNLNSIHIIERTYKNSHMNSEMVWDYFKKYQETKIQLLMQASISQTRLIILDKVKTYHQTQNKNSDCCQKFSQAPK